MFIKINIIEIRTVSFICFYSIFNNTLLEIQYILFELVKNNKNKRIKAQMNAFFT
jgi:hypothetical protein